MKKISIYSEEIAYKAKKSVGNGFFKWGMFVGKYPLYVLIGSLIFSGLCAIGLVNVETITTPDKLWVSTKSDFVKQKIHFEDAFGAFYRLNLVIITPKEGDDVIAIPNVIELHYLHRNVTSITVTDPSDDTEITFASVCAHVYKDSPCLLQTALDYWTDDLDTIIADIDPHNSVSNQGARTPYGGFIDAVTVMGLMDRVGDNVLSAKAFMNTYLLNNTVNDDYDMARKSALWEKKFIETMHEFNKTTEHINIFFQAERSIQDELDERIAADTKYIIISYVIMFVYTILALGRFDPVESKIIIGILAVCLEVLAIVISLGITSAGGVPLSPITLQVLPFLILGIGINDVFVITAIFVQNPVKGNSSEAQRLRLAESLKRIGPSMLLSYTTNVSALLVGASTVMPAARDFCFQAALAMAMSFVLLLTMYSSALIFDGLRIQKNRFDVFCCITRKKQIKETKIEENNGNNKVNDVYQVDKRDLLRYLLVKYYLKFLSFKATKIGVLIITLVLIGGGIYGCTRISKGLGVTDVVPSDSYVATFLDKRSEFFAILGAPVYFVFGDLEYSDWAVQDKMDTMLEKIRSGRWFTGVPVSWWESFKFWVPTFGFHGNHLINGRIPPGNFTQWLNEFLVDKTFGKYFSYDIDFSTDGSIKNSRWMINSVGLNTTEDYINAIESAIKITDDSSLDTFPYSLFYIFFEQYIIISNESIRGILCSLAVVFVVSFLFIMHIGAAGIVLLTIGLIEIEYVGIMFYWDIDLNALSSVNLIMGTGLAVSFTVYTVLAFMESKLPTRQARVDEAMSVIGVSVLNGAISTILGVFLLAFAEYNLFRTYYFKMYMAIVMFGIFYGFFFLPVILSLIGPSYSSKILNRNDEDNIDLTTLSRPTSVDDEPSKNSNVTISNFN